MKHVEERQESGKSNAATLDPPGRCTGFSNPRCFAASDNNCSTTISREHFISETLLRQFELNNTAKIAGLRWQEREQFNILPIKALASNILCDRHNSALSRLDSTIGSFSTAIADFDAALHEKSTAPTRELRKFEGDQIELWMLKCVIGMTVSGNITGKLRPECIDLLYGRMPWPEGWGLYWLNTGDATKYHSQSIAIETKLHPQTQSIVLIKFHVRGLPFGLCLGKPDHPDQFGIIRPDRLIFRAGARRRDLILKWRRATAGLPIVLNRAGSYDGPPPTWREWERDG